MSNYPYASMRDSFDLSAYFVVGPQDCKGRPITDVIDDALRGGASFIQLRVKDADAKDLTDMARDIAQIIEDNNKSDSVAFVIDDRVDVAIACDAAGVHVGSSDLPVAVARKLLGPDKIVGATAKTVEAAKKAYEDGADYLGVGAIFPTTTKVVTIRTSVETLNEICQSVPIPAVAIGGLNDGNMDILKGGKMAGVAVVSAIMKAEDPKAAAIQLKEHVGKLRG